MKERRGGEVRRDAPASQRPSASGAAPFRYRGAQFGPRAPSRGGATSRASYSHTAAVSRGHGLADGLPLLTSAHPRAVAELVEVRCCVRPSRDACPWRKRQNELAQTPTARTGEREKGPQEVDSQAVDGELLFADAKLLLRDAILGSSTAVHRAKTKTHIKYTLCIIT